MPGPDLDQRLAATFAALGEPVLSADQRSALGPALRRRRARRQRLASGVGVALLIAGLAVGLPLGLRSAPVGPVALREAPTTCVEVQIGGTQSCRGSLIVAHAPASSGLAVPAGPTVPASAGESAPTNGPTQPVGLTVGARLVVSLPSGGGVRWSPVQVVPPPANAQNSFSTTLGGVTARTTRTDGRTVATVTALSPGNVSLGAQGRTVCPAGKTGCVVRSVTWTWVVRVTAPGAASGTP